MKFDKKTTFPYPVLGVNDDISPGPDFSTKLEESDESFLLTVKININNPSIQYYINTLRMAEYVCEIDCVSTYYRKSIVQNSPDFFIKIPKKLVAKEINVVFTVTANTSIQNYFNSRANTDYTGFTFDLEKGDLMAIIGSFLIQTDIKSEEFKTVGSFIHFSCGIPKSNITYNLDGDDIEIKLPEEMFKIYVQKLKIDKYRPMILASIINEALIYALLNLRMYSYKRWARVLSTAIATCEELSDLDLSEQNSNDSSEMEIADAFEIARVLLKNPHKELFETLNNFEYDID